MTQNDAVAQLAGGYSDDEWAALATSADPLDAYTVTNFRVIADRVSGFQGWQPIESLPEPEALFGPLTMFWLPSTAPGQGVIKMRRVASRGHFWNRYDNGYEGDWFKPTHWMPLPSPPTRSEGAEPA